MTKKIDPAITGRKPRATKAEMATRSKLRLGKVDRGHFSLLPGIIAERERDLAARQTRLEQEQAVKVCNSSQTQPLNLSRDCQSDCVRPGAEVFLHVPSRFGDVLRYRDGRRVGVSA